MLAAHPIDTILLSTDLAASRTFYGDVLGLPLLDDDGRRIVLGCGGASRLVVTTSATGTADTQTRAFWRVDDLDHEVATLRVRGVHFEDYDDEEFRSVGGILDLGWGRAAWFCDPHGNALGVVQVR